MRATGKGYKLSIMIYIIMTKNKKQLTTTKQDILSEIKSGSGLQKALAPLVKRVMEVALEEEFENHLEEKSEIKNYRNGKSIM